MTNKFLRKLFGNDNILDNYLTNNYYTFFEKYENFKFILNIIKNDSLKKIEKTDTIICFKGIIDFGMHQNQVKKLIPNKPIWVFQESNINNHEVYFYKWRISGFRVKAELHFLNQYFFMGVYTFDSYSKSYYNKIKNLLLNKYKVSYDKLNAQSINIVDEHNNLITVRELHDFSIIYFTGENKVLQNLLEQTTQIELKEKEKEKEKEKKILEWI